MNLSEVHALFYEQLLLKLGQINPASSPNSFNLAWAKKQLPSIFQSVGSNSKHQANSVHVKHNRMHK